MNSHIEKLAIAIHGDYRKQLAARGQTDAPYDMPWEQLPEDIKDANRAQAADIAHKLDLIGCGYDAGDTPFPSVDAFTEAEILFLAQGEHDRWMQNRRDHGWRYGKTRDNERKIHPLLVPWDELPQEERQKDVDVVRNIIPLLKSVGLRVYRLV